MTELSFIMLQIKPGQFERAFLLFLKWGSVLLLLLVLLAILGRFAHGFRKMKIQDEIKKHGLKDVIIREVDSKVVDDTLANAIMGHEIGGSLGAILGALSGSQQEYIKSVRFWIKLGNGEKKEITLKPKDDLYRRLISFLDKRDYEEW